MKDKLIGTLIAFKANGEGDEFANGNVIIEVTDFTKSGEIELAFTAPIPGNPRIYLKMSLPEIIEVAMATNGTSE